MVEDKNPEKINGVEEEIIIGEEDFQEPYDVSSIRIDPMPMTVFEAMDRVKRGEINLQPDFQRELVWNIVQQSRLIESILIKIPLPSFYLDATNDDEWLVVDGLQRLNTLHSFINKEEFALKHLEFLGSDVREKKFSHLSRKMQRRIETAQLMLYIIKPDTPEDAKFTIFRRLNTGGQVLNAQEIRHCIYQGKSTKLLKELASLEEFKRVTNSSIPSKRMVDRECALRFCAFYLTNYKEYKKADLDAFLGYTMKKINNMKDEEIELLKNAFKNAMFNSEVVFDKYAFRKITEKNGRFNPVNKALFETWSVFLEKYPMNSLSEYRKRIVDSFIKVMNEDKVFVDSISQGTGDTKKVNIRFETVKNIIEEAIK